MLTHRLWSYHLNHMDCLNKISFARTVLEVGGHIRFAPTRTFTPRTTIMTLALLSIRQGDFTVITEWNLNILLEWYDWFHISKSQWHMFLDSIATSSAATNGNSSLVELAPFLFYFISMGLIQIDTWAAPKGLKIRIMHCLVPRPRPIVYVRS